MDKMNELLKKYFRGETNLAEEKELKHYFLATQVKPEHEAYRPLFETFDQELNETVPIFQKKILSLQSNKKRFWIRTISFSGIAATLLLSLWLIRSQPTDDFAILRGKRIDNPEYAQHYAQNKLDKVNNVLLKSLKPMKSFEIARNGLKPVHKIAETKERMIDIKDKLQYK